MCEPFFLIDMTIKKNKVNFLLLCLYFAFNNN